MANHGTTIGDLFVQRLRKRADEIQPPADDADILRSFANPPDPVGFARRVLAFMPWSRQREILEAVATYQRVSVVSGHKVGKSTSYAILALWFYCSFPNARVVITSTTDNQVNGIIWREIKRLARASLIPIPGVAPSPGNTGLAIRANTGVTHPETLSEIRGYTAKEAEAIAGVSGAYVMYLVDEASGVENFIFEAIEGNRAGGNAWVLLCSNPTKATGEFYESFYSKSRDTLGDAGYFNVHIDSRESPNVTGEWATLEEYDRKTGEWKLRSEPVPGLAQPGWVAEKLREWGENDSRFLVRIAGSFVVAEEAKVFQLGLLEASQLRWPETTPEETDGLIIGCDPAGDGDGGDESAFAPRRGLKAYPPRTRRGISPAEHIVELQDIIAEHYASGAPKTPKPLVNCESEGEASWKVYVVLREHADRTGEFDVHRMRTSERAPREPLIYGTLRDEMYAAARLWMREGGAIPESSKLEKDLHTPEFSSDAHGRLKLTAKRDLKKLLGRSPDTGDAFVLSCWVPRFYVTGGNPEASGVKQAADAYEQIAEPILDPYAGSFV
jgi:phage terminase large subunit